MSDEAMQAPGFRETADHRFHDDQHLLRREHAGGYRRGFRGDHSGELCDGEFFAGLGPRYPHHPVYSKMRKSGILLILLDESTASVDPENETIIQKAIGRLIENKTVLIAYKPRSIVACGRP